MFQFLFRRFSKPSAPPPSARLRLRLGCEMLEDRLTPSAASFYWAGNGSNGYGDPANWYSSGNFDPNHLVPISGDSVFVASGGGFTVPADYTFDWFVASSDFMGTIELQDNTTIGSLYMGGGNLAMVGSSGSGNDLFVTQNFVFTKGNLNSSANTGTVHLQGIPSAAIGTDAGTVITGSTLSVEYGTTLKYAMGTIAFSNQATILTYAGSNFVPIDLDAVQVGQGFIHVNQPLQMTNGAIVFEGYVIQNVDSKIPILVRQTGTLIITKSCAISGTLNVNEPGSASLGMVAGNIVVSNGVGITLEHGLSMSGGTFSSVHPAGYTGARTIYITGNISVSGGTIVELGSNADSQCSAFSVTGNVYFAGGEFKAKVNGTQNSVERDLWICSGKFKIAAAATITPIVLYATPANVVGRTWDVIQATGLFFDATLPATIAGWEFLPVGNGQNLTLRKKP